LQETTLGTVRERAPAREGLAARDLYVIPFTPDDFHRIRQLIYKVAGISLSPAKQDLVYSRLARRLRVLGLDSFAAYLRKLQTGDQQELEAFINALTTNLTSFFREAHHFPILAKHLEGVPRNRPATIWTCASSTGEEPYSLAMTAVETFGSFQAPVRILATDIDTEVLERAREGVYALDQLEKLTPAQLRRFFLKGDGRNAGFARVRPELKKLVSFRRLNLLDERWGLVEQYDAIFCRNVLIYFDKETQQQVLRRMAPRLQPDGLLFVGHSESLHHSAETYRIFGKTVYALR